MPHEEGPQPNQDVEAFKSAVEKLLKPDNPHAKSLFAFIRRTLGQYKLTGIYSESDIFNEAFERGLRKSESERIINPKAWLRSTSFNVMKENVRLAMKTTSLDEDILSDQEEECFEDLTFGNETFEVCRKAVVEAFSKLNHQDRKIIELRCLEGRTWKDVREKLGENKTNLPALRQRGQRALEKLRKEYHKIRPSRVVDDDIY
jgi:RNA polymerase sigma factor (sigma-70 family)